VFLLNLALLAALSRLPELLIDVRAHRLQATRARVVYRGVLAQLPLLFLRSGRFFLQMVCTQGALQDMRAGNGDTA